MMGDAGPGHRYVVISSDCHAGADILGYRPYLETRWHDEFDAWASSYSDPWAELESADIMMGVASFASRLNWESSRRLEILETQGVAAEVLFPNTAPPFFPSGAVSAPPPKDRAEYERRFAGLRAHNRWLVDFCADAPGRRAGVAQLFLQDLDDALAEIRWVASSGLTGGILLPGSPPLYSPRLEPVWQLCSELDITLNMHGGGGIASMTSEDGPVGPALFFLAGGGTNPYIAAMIFAGVFERYPNLRFVTTEGGIGWLPDFIRSLDVQYKAALVDGGLMAYFVGPAARQIPRLPSEYVARNCYFGASFMTREECDVRYDVGVDRIMWGADLPHIEGTYPYTCEAQRAAFAGVPPAEVQQMLSAVAAEVYGFDVVALQTVADRIGPTVEQIEAPLTSFPRFPDETLSPPLTTEPVHRGTRPYGTM